MKKSQNLLCKLKQKEKWILFTSEGKQKKSGFWGISFILWTLLKFKRNKYRKLANDWKEFKTKFIELNLVVIWHSNILARFPLHVRLHYWAITINNNVVELIFIVFIGDGTEWNVI